jgi:hypothetical protein
MPDDNLDQGLPVTEQPEGDGLVNEAPEVNEGDSQEGQSQEVPQISAYEALKTKKNWSTDDQVAQSYESVEAYARQTKAELDALKASLGQPAKEDDEETDWRDDMRGVVSEVVQQALSPLRNEIYGGHLDKAESEVAEAIGPSFEALKQTPMYQQIRQTALHTDNPAKTYQEMVLGFLQMAQSVNGSPETLINSGIQQGQATERSKQAAHLLPGGSTGASPINNQPRDEAQDMLAAAHRMSTKGVLGY